MKLNLKISILVGILSFIIAFGIGYYTQVISTKELEKSAGKSLLTLAKNTADILDREMLERYREIEFASTLPPLIDPNSSKEEKRAFLEKLKGKHEHHEWIGYALPSGLVEAGTSGYLEGKNASSRPWLPNGLKGPYIGDVHDALLLAKLLPNNSGEAIYFIDVAFPVKSKEGETLGVLCTHLMWQWTRNIIRSIEKENSVEVFLLSKDNMVLVGPNGTEREELKNISKNAAKAFTNKTEYKIVTWTPENNYLTAHTISNGFEEYKGFGWKVIVRQATNEAFEKANANKNRIILISLVIAILGGIIGIILSNIITKPLKKLSLYVEKMREGKDLDFQQTNSTNEIAILEKALYDLDKSLKNEKSLRDIAEEKVEIALAVFDQSLEGILITDEDNKIILINKSFTKITGYEIEDVYGKNPNILSSKETPKETYEDMWRSIKKVGKWEGKVKNIKKDGNTYIENLRISCIQDSNNKIKYYFAVFNSGF